MPATQYSNGVTTSDIERATQSLDLYERTWSALQNADDLKEQVEIVNQHTSALAEEIGHFPHHEKIEHHDKENGVITVFVYVWTDDTDRPVDLLYYDYEPDTLDAHGGDIALY